MLLRRIAKWFVSIAVLLYLTACVFMFSIQRSIVFAPGLEDVALDVGRVPHASLLELMTADGENLKAWWVPPLDAGQAVYLYFHGNAETLATRDKRFGLLTAEGAGLLAVSWRGYGGSTGSPSEEGLRVDAETAWNWLREQGIGAERLIVFGESLGTGIATWFVSTHEAAALVLDSPFTAIYHIGQERYPWLPVSLLARDRFDSLALAPGIGLPTVVFHCTEDRIVPYRMGRALFEALGSRDKTFVDVEGRCHVPSVQTVLPRLRELELNAGKGPSSPGA